MEKTTAQRRLTMVTEHLKPTEVYNYGNVKAIHDDDVVIISYARTALGKAGRGSFKDTALETMLTPVMKAAISKGKIDPALLEDISIGCTIPPGCGIFPCRMAQMLAGIPHTTPLHTINRFCSSGLHAVATIANQISSGQIQCGMGGGVESMSTYDMTSGVDPEKISEAIYDHEQARNCMMPMGLTSENVAEKYGISREKQDLMAFESHQKAHKAFDKLKAEITPVTTQIKDKDGNLKTIIVDKDEGIRPQTTLEGLAKLKPAFKKTGTTTAGNSSQVTDGASVVILAKRSFAKKHGLPIEGRILSFAVAGCPPELMGIGPAVAIPKAIEKSGVSLDKIDVFEINEAFASQATYSIEKVGVPREKLNPRGGAIALGHPLGNTGSRQIVTLFSELKDTGKRYGLTSMCIGTGMGAAAVFERE